jgi:heat shock protein beta
VKKMEIEWVLLNENKAIWLRNANEIEEEEYNKFFKSLSRSSDDPLGYIHFKTDGGVEFRSILFIPASAPSDMFENYYGKTSSLKLYVRRVLINDEFEDLIPKYLSFIKGVVDSDDLPLNVNREQL